MKLLAKSAIKVKDTPKESNRIPLEIQPEKLSIEA